MIQNNPDAAEQTGAKEFGFTTTDPLACLDGLARFIDEMNAQGRIDFDGRERTLLSA
ncbi:hypothetical protein [Methylobacterium sp. GC_Met_2]|uniref:hypothetical protein n=1 Tax=Methylobacterium sp. GC_Met_2 TaxID=2937376 RepID=UPI00226B9E42|nr:hypothetical protein [Methylobacterium sp. GC_Met_2]